MVPIASHSLACPQRIAAEQAGCATRRCRDCRTRAASSAVDTSRRAATARAPRSRPARKRSGRGLTDIQTLPSTLLPVVSGTSLAVGASLTSAADGWSVFEPLFTTTVATAVLTSCAVSAWPLLAPAAAPPRRRRTRQSQLRSSTCDSSEADGEGVYGAASVISCIPYTNWAAWLGLALLDSASFGDSTATSQDRSGRYALFALIYALPYLHCGLDIDSLALFSLLVGIVHIQVEFLSRASRNGGGSGGSDTIDASTSISDWLSMWSQPPAGAQQRRSQRLSGSATTRRAIASDDTTEEAAESLEKEPSAGAGAPSSVARKLGERIGELTAKLATLRADFVEGKAEGQTRATLLAQEQRAQAELEALRVEAKEELVEWDVKYNLAAATRTQLLQIARSRRVVGASRLSKRELVSVLEASMALRDTSEDSEDRT